MYNQTFTYKDKVIHYLNKPGVKTTETARLDKTMVTAVKITVI